MGSGCSSPLRRLGGKRGKPRRDSSPFEINGNNSDNQEQRTKINLENEITIQSEINEDHPSSASYYTDGKNQNEETKISEHSEPKSSLADPVSSTTGGGSVVARMMGLDGAFLPLDRHLLVSPALSPAPSTCYSPSSAGSIVGCNSSIDLSDLNEAFKTLTFGLPDQANLIKQPGRPHSEVHNHYTQQLVQSQSDLINYISVIFATTDSFQFNSPDGKQSAGSNSTTSSQKIELLANHIESNSKAFCDQHLFNLRFFNLSLSHLTEHFHINNLIDVSMKILEEEYLENSQRLIVIILSNNSNNINGGSIEALEGVSEQNQVVDTKQLPTKIEAQSMNKLIKSSMANSDDHFRELLKRWYNQANNIFYLNPLYQVYPKILAHSKEERDQAWQDWLQDASSLIKSIEIAIEKEPELASEIKFRSLFESLKEFIMKESALQKRTLLIRNYLQPSISSTNLQQQQNQPSSLGQNKYGSLSELARLLPDPNKLTIKRSMNDEEFIRTGNDWINENLSKFVESIQENQITRGKHVPPFIDRNLFRELTSQRHNLFKHLDNLTESFETKNCNFYKSQISPILNNIVSNSNNNLPSSSSDSTPTTDMQASSSLQPSTNHLVFISGPKGCGKSTLFAQIIKLTIEDLLNKVQIIYRFCGQTLDSSTPNRLLRSICEQFCQIQGENITAASYIYSARKDIINALNKILNLQSSIIFLDGLDIYDKSQLPDLDWLHEIKAHCRLRIIVTLETDSELYKKVLDNYSDATYISLDNPTTSEWAQMLTSTARSRRFNSNANLYDEIKNMGISASSKEDSNLNYNDVSDVINMCRLRQLNNESIYPELSLKNMQNEDPLHQLKNIPQVVLTHLHYLITPHQLCSLFVMLDSSRIGLSESDIINIMTLISQTSKSGQGIDLKFSSALLNYLRFQLQPWLVHILCDKTVKITVQKDFLKKVIDYYVPNIYPTIVSEVREVLLNYFSRQAKAKLSRSSIFKGESSQVEFRDNVGPSESQWLSSQSSEIVNLLILTNPAKARDYILNRNQFFLQFLYSSMPEEFIEDCQRLKDITGKKSSTNSEELQCLVSYVMRSIHPLRYDGSQIFSQIYCRAYETMKTGKFSKSKKFNDILNVAACPPIRNLLPISEASVNSFIKARIGQKAQNSGPSLNTPSMNNQKSTKSSVYSNSQQSSGPSQSRQRIYTIKGNHRHVIVIYPDRGSLSVWDIFEEKAVRTISNIDQPRDLKMIDQIRAVILCNRELRVYDLDSGNLLTKLKGVMNQKMPFFEVFEENYVVALARNRMYVNMLNLNTGELETTFKVGEDRFLNSLLVSADGGICVCGDETQKPFPLLVWDLNERRLLYDLRLDRHEFITRMSAISDDGHFVVSVCKQVGDSNDNSTLQSNSGSSSIGGGAGGGSGKTSPNFIVIYDLNSGTLFKKWKPGLDSCAVAISLSANRSGKVINTIIDSSILVWDLATGSRR